MIVPEDVGSPTRSLRHLANVTAFLASVEDDLHPLRPIVGVARSPGAAEPEPEQLRVKMPVRTSPTTVMTPLYSSGG